MKFSEKLSFLFEIFSGRKNKKTPNKQNQKLKGNTSKWMHSFFSHLPVPQHGPPALLDPGRFFGSLQAVMFPAVFVGLSCTLLLLFLPYPPALLAQGGAKHYLLPRWC